MAFLRHGGTAVSAVEMALMVLEDAPITNAGLGSNLNEQGIVECDASIVDHFGRSGAVGAVPSEWFAYVCAWFDEANNGNRCQESNSTCPSHLR